MNFEDMPSYPFRLPLPPSVNHDRWVNPKTKRYIISDKSRQWKKHADALLYQQGLPSFSNGRSNSEWSMTINFVFHYVNSKRRIDCDNRLKPLIDAISLRLGIDDTHLISYQVTKTSKQVECKTEDYVYGDIVVLELGP